MSSRVRLSLLALAIVIGCLAAVTMLAPAVALAGESASTEGWVASQLGDALGSGSVLAFVMVFFGGVLTSLTPCVYPLIPITVSVFGARESKSRLGGLALGLAYVLGMGVTYTAAGLAAALTGRAFGSLLGNIWFVGAIAALFVALALSMFGLYKISLPASLAMRLNRVGGTGYAGAFGMGLVAGVIAAPCTGPVLATVLTFVAKSQDPLLGGLLLFTFALGMGMLFLFLATFSVSLPKSGRWMEAVESVFGVVMLWAALYFLQGAWPALPGLMRRIDAVLGGGLLVLLVAVVTVGVGIVAGAFHISFHDPGWVRRARKGVGIAAALVGLWIGIGHFLVSKSDFPWTPYAQTQVETAAAEGLPVMIDFWAEWCVACNELERFTFSTPDIQAEARRFRNLKVDATREDDLIRSLYDRYGVKGLPTIVFIGSSGAVLDSPRITGFVAADPFLELMRTVR